MSGRATKRAEQRRRAGAAEQRARAAAFHNPVEHLVRRRKWLALAGLLALYLLLALLSFEPQPHTGGDNAGYITLANSLRDRGAYLDLYDPAEPPHTKYTPVFPLVLGLGLALGLKPWVGLKLIVLALGGGAVAGTYLWIRRRGRPALALAVGALLALAPGVLRESHWVLSDVPFWYFTTVALLAFERLRPDDWRRFALALLATVLAYFTRSAGLPLVLAAAGWLLWRRHWRQLLAFALVLAPLALLWWLRAKSVGGVQYVGEFWLIDPYQPHLGRVDAGGLAARFGENVQKYITLHLPIILSGAPGGLALLAGAGTVALGIYGWARRLRRARVAELFLPLYLGLILLWPAVWSGERFLLPALGLILCYAGDGLVRLAGRVRSARTVWLGTGAFALLTLIALPGVVRSVRQGTACTRAYLDGNRFACLDPASAEFFALAEWARTGLPRDAVVLSRKPRLFYVFSGLQGRNYPMATTTEALLATADSAGARWVVFDQLGGLAQRYLAPAILQRPAAFCMAQSTANQGAVLFGIRPDAHRIPDSPAAGEAVSFQPCGEAGPPPQ